MGQFVAPLDLLKFPRHFVVRDPFIVQFDEFQSNLNPGRFSIALESANNDW